jgi:DNA-binding transcriptional MerR regulator
MTVLTDIKRMQVEGKTEAEILSTLKQQGVSPREITEALSQSKIREAVAGESPYGNPEAVLMPSQEQAAPAEEMVPSVAAQQQAQENYPPQYPQPYEQQYQQAQAPPQQAQYPPQYPQQYEPQYQTYQPQPQMGSISPDTITEISEQVVAEKLAPLRKDIEKVLDLKTTMETKMEYLDERLKRIEKIIDRLQLSIMQKVGEYITNIDDIKKEITETQKSFKAMVPGLPSSSSSKEERAEKPKKSKDELP